MKKILYVLLAIMLMDCTVYGTPGTSAGKSAPDSLVLLTTPELKDLVAGWAQEYAKSAPDQPVGVSAALSSGQTPGSGEICFAQEKDIPGAVNNSGMRIVVGRSVVVPVINKTNPLIEEIRATGISPEKMKMMMDEPQLKWAKIFDRGQDRAVRIHLLNDQMVINSLADFLGIDPDNMKGIRHNDAGELLAAVAGDVYSVGFCRLTDITGPGGETASGAVTILPVDKNGNGAIESTEDIYGDLNAFTRGVWIGKYPGALFSNIYSVTRTPVTKEVTAFLNWVITGGQDILVSGGYTGLTLTERMSDAGRIAEAQVTAAADINDQNIFITLLVVLAVSAACVFIAGIIMKATRKKPVVNPVVTRTDGPVLDEKSLLLPKGVYFDKTHTWAFLEQDGVVKVGVDDFLLHMTGPVNRIKMKKPGDKVKKGEELLSVIRNGKHLNLYSPVTGVIKETNGELESDAALINSSPYGSGWVYRVEPENWQRENQLLFMAEKHKQFILNEITRIKDFLAVLLRNENMQYSPVILQDGGMLCEGVLADMSPEVWEEFQTKIIDPSRTVWFYEII